MTQKRKARPAGSAAEQAKQGNHRISGNPRIDFITGRRKISSLLNYGQENAVNRRYLEAITGLDGRTVRLLIERERRGGMPILSDNSSGYFLPGSELERAAFVCSMKHRAGEIIKTARAIEEAK